MPVVSTIATLRTPRTLGMRAQRAVELRGLDFRGIEQVPARRIAQQQTDVLPVPRRLPCQCRRHIAELAFGRRERMEVRAPDAVATQSHEARDYQRAENDRPAPQGRIAPRIGDGLEGAGVLPDHKESISQRQRSLVSQRGRDVSVVTVAQCFGEGRVCLQCHHHVFQSK